MIRIIFLDYDIIYNIVMSLKTIPIGQSIGIMDISMRGSKPLTPGPMDISMRESKPLTSGPMDISQNNGRRTPLERQQLVRQPLVRQPVKVSQDVEKFKHVSDKIRLNQVTSLCLDPDYCIMLGIHTNSIKNIFNDYHSFDYATKIRPLGVPSVNGFIRQIFYNRSVDGKQYTSTAILKSARDNPNVDNLYYEYQVGIFINYISKLFPIFVDTYGLLVYKNEAAYNNILGEKWYPPLNKYLSERLHFIASNDQSMSYSCQHANYIALLVETVKDSVTLDKLIPNQLFQQYDLFPTCFLIYSILSILKNKFTHYDLHHQNVMMIPCLDQKGYFQYNLHLMSGIVVVIKSRYLPKIIDYGRCFYYMDQTTNSMVFSQQVCQNCQNCGKSSGFGWLNSINNSYINSSVRNISHDLRLIKMISSLVKNNVFMKDISEKIVYDNQYGTAENTMSIGDNNRINNVTDMAFYLYDLWKNHKSNCFPEFPSDFKMYAKFDIYLDDVKPSAYTIMSSKGEIGLPSDRI